MKRSLAFILAGVLLMFSACGNTAPAVETSSSAPEPSESSAVESSVSSEESSEAEPSEAPVEIPMPDDKLITLLTATNSDLQVTDKEFTDGEIHATYPQITGYEHESTHEEVNKAIEEHVMQLIESNKTEGEEMTLTISYEVKIINDALVSIAFSGDGNFEGAAHPWRFFSTLNLDTISSNPTVELDDYYTLDEGFLDALLANPVSGEAEQQKEAVAQLKEAKEETLAYLQGVDSGDLSFSYFTEDAVGICLPVIHALGDYMVFELPIGA